ncbi:hypothetical protein BSLG_007046 [Batrachochytrium salamandrivorans]|nr:hypothetical protein BASA81_013668 [Batrachochytrium salamandrivorans]KAJ1336727.1 hypothetical protein BSLG_007046 [Batrachochytrium salamandrivorans]
MRAGTGIILSVLSFSVLAAVIPNYDSHGILLVRRAVNPDPMDLLWKRNNGEQAGPGPSSSGAGASTETGAGIGESNPNSSSINSGLSKMDRLRDFSERVRMRFMKNRDPRKQQYILKSEERSLQNAAKKLAEATNGISKDQFVIEVVKLLRTALDGARSSLKLYETKLITLFSLSISKGKNRKSLAKKMVKIQNNGKKYTNQHLKAITHAINGIIKHPQRVMAEMDKITGSAARISTMLGGLYSSDYKTLISKVGSTGNEENIKETENYLSEIEGHRDGVLKVVKIIKGEITSGRVTFKGKNTSKFGAFKSGVQRRLGLKSSSSTGRVLTPEETGQQIPGQDTSNENTSNQGPPNQEESDQARARPIPPPRKSRASKEETWV